MPYFAIEDFKAGLDVRRSRFTSVPGTLQKLENAHITRGGDIEQRKAFVQRPVGVPGLGIAAHPTWGLIGFLDTLPEGMSHTSEDATWTWIVPPSSSLDLVSIDSVTPFGGKLYVAATYSNGKQYHFLDTLRIADWWTGVVDTYITTNIGIAANLGKAIDLDPNYTATYNNGAPAPFTVSYDTITITGLPGVDYTIETSAENNGVVADAGFVVTELIAPIASVTAEAAFGEFAIITGADDNGVANYVDLIRVDDNGAFTNLVTTNIPFENSPETTAARVAAAINAGTTTHGYKATTKYGFVQIYAPLAQGDSANGRVIEATCKGKCIMFNGGYRVVDGTVSAGVNKVTSIKANGKEILGASIDYVTDNTATAAALATQIRAYASSPKYTAHNEGANIFISPETIRSDSASGISLLATCDGNVVLDSDVEVNLSEIYGGVYAGSGRCVAVESFLPDFDGTAEDVRVGNMLQLADPWTWEAATGEVQSAEPFEARCFRITTRCGASLVCSETAPIPIRGNAYRIPEDLKGCDVPVMRDGAVCWSEVTHVEYAGLRWVMKIYVGDRCFWAGETPDAFILHHNAKNTNTESML
jgi:hypothetical protein